MIIFPDHFPWAPHDCHETLVVNTCVYWKNKNNIY